MFYLTKEERAVVISLSFIFLIGLSFHYAFKKNPHLLNLVNVIEGDRIYPKVNLNKASLQELTQVPYIGHRTAERILEYRKNNGPFQSVEQLKLIKGIYANRYKTIRKYLKIN